MTRRRASTLIEALMAAVIVAVIGALVVIALAEASQAGQRAMLAAQARRVLQQELEQVRSGRGVPTSGTSGPFTVTVTTSTNNQPTMIGGPWTPDCYGGSPCSNSITTSTMYALTYVKVVVSYTADGTVVASGTTATPP